MLMVRRNILHFTWKYFAWNLLFGETMTEKRKLYLYFQHIGKTANWNCCENHFVNLCDITVISSSPSANRRLQIFLESSWGLVDWKCADLVAFSGPTANPILHRFFKRFWETIATNCVNLDVSLIVLLQSFWRSV